jgi:hypothetical protein
VVRHVLFIAVLGILGFASGGTAQVTTPPPAAQSASPMVEQTRAHERLAPRDVAGTRRSFAGPGGKAVDVVVPPGLRADSFDLVIHFLGAAWLPQQAVAALNDRTVSVVINLGAGSSAYERPFVDAAAFDSLTASVAREVTSVIGRPAHVARMALVGFSAGYGAVRAILRDPRHFAVVDAVLLLDGLHTSYVPEGSLLATGGALDSTNLTTFASFARAAVRGEKRFVITHSEIFPGTFASTTETTDWLLRSLGLRRTPVLRWGPRGMQQLSEVQSGRFELLGFAGNSAPDHIDHLHALPELLRRLFDR